MLNSGAIYVIRGRLAHQILAHVRGEAWSKRFPRAESVRSGRAGLVIAVALGLLCGRPWPARAGTDCVADTSGMDVSLADNAVSVCLCRSWGQVFFAKDTLIQAISVWRYVPPDTNNTPEQLYVFGVDANGVPQTSQTLLVGPVVYPPGVTNGKPEKVRFVLNPPLALPRRGKYFLAVKEGTGYGCFWLMVNDHDADPEGQLWELGSSRSCVPDGTYDTVPSADLAFLVEYCATSGVTGVSGSLPQRYVLYPSRPNPFRGKTAVSFDLPIDADVKLAVFDAEGRRVRTLAAGPFTAGSHSVEWDHRDAAGEQLAPGVYLYQIRSGTFGDQKKVILLP